MLGVLWIVRQFPRQIRRDLHRFHNGLKLADWWRGTCDASGDPVLSSSELLDYLEFMDDDGAFKTKAERGGRWPDWKAMLAEIANEGYRLRSSYFAVNSEDGEGGFKTVDMEFIDPMVMTERKRIEAEKSAVVTQSVSRFESEMGFT